MFGKIARVAFLLLLGVMIVSWAVSVSSGKNQPVDPDSDLPTDRMYS